MSQDYKCNRYLKKGRVTDENTLHLESNLSIKYLKFTKFRITKYLEDLTSQVHFKTHIKKLECVL